MECADIVNNEMWECTKCENSFASLIFVLYKVKSLIFHYHLVFLKLMILKENVLSISLLKKMFCTDTQGHKTESEKATQTIAKIVILTLLLFKGILLIKHACHIQNFFFCCTKCYV